jgi:1,4-alpha-glucan branching enzyme
MGSMSGISDFDAYLIAQGKHHQAYDVLGAHVQDNGTRFAVWAPDAEEVSVIGDFNGWTAGRDLLMPQGDSGVWQGFLPGMGVGVSYKYAIRPRGRVRRVERADPYAFAAELRPRTASVTADLSDYVWDDAEWMGSRRSSDWRSAPMAVYEAHLGSWMQDMERDPPFLTYRELADRLVRHARSLGFSHIELMPVAEHPLDMSWGYQVTGFYAPTARFGRPEDFMYFVDQCHRGGLGVILDWVPAHFPRDAHGLARFDGSHLYEHADPRQGTHPDWGTLIFNYGRNEVRTFLISNALFWLDRYHVDGIRVDAVASMLYLDYSRAEGEWIPNRYGGRENLEAVEFLRELNGVVHARFPDTLTIAEESTAWPGVTAPLEHGGLGFDLKWNMGWMHDTLEYIEKDPIHRQFHQNQLTFPLMYAFSERFLLPISHDEVTHGKRSLVEKMPGDAWQKFANVRLLLTWMYGHPGKKLLFMGSEFGQIREWQYDRSLDWHLVDTDEAWGDPHRGLLQFVTDLNRLYRAQPQLHEVDFDSAGFEWTDFADAENSVVVFRRLAASDPVGLIFACNFTPVTRAGYRIGLSENRSYRVLLNTDSVEYGGSGAGSNGSMRAEAISHHHRPFSAEVTLPPLGVLILGPAAINPRPVRTTT